MGWWFFFHFLTRYFHSAIHSLIMRYFHCLHYDFTENLRYRIHADVFQLKKRNWKCSMFFFNFYIEHWKKNKNSTNSTLSNLKIFPHISHFSFQTTCKLSKSVQISSSASKLFTTNRRVLFDCYQLIHVSD